MSLELTRCRSEECRASIFWARTTRGKRMPVDAMPTEDGNVEIVSHGQDGPIVKIHKTGQPALFEERRYTSHFATCPDAEGWRRRDG